MAMFGYGVGTGAGAGGAGVKHTSGKPISIPIICVFANMIVLLQVLFGPADLGRSFGFQLSPRSIISSSPRARARLLHVVPSSFTR
jgi:hypothetical protein